MSNLVPHPPGGLASPSTIGAGRPSRRTSREVARAVEQEHARGVVAAATAQAEAYAAAVTVQSATMVGQLGMTAIGMLAMEERQLAMQTPHAVNNLQAVLDSVTAVVAREIAGLGWSA
jgi:hypothetical protein